MHRLNSRLQLNSLESRVVPCSTGWQGTICAPVSGQFGASECGGQHPGEFGHHQNFGFTCSHGQNSQGQCGGTTTGQGSTVTISGVVFADGPGTGLYTSTDALLSGSTVTLTGTNILGQTVDVSVTTGANGAYSFTGVLPGTYAITYTAIANYVNEAPGGTPSGSVSAAGSVSNIVVVSGTNVTVNLPELPMAVPS